MTADSGIAHYPPWPAVKRDASEIRRIFEVILPVRALRADRWRFAFHYHYPLQPRGAALKERVLIVAGRLPRFAPGGPVSNNPIRQRPFKPNIMTRFFRLNPLVFENLLALCLKFPVKRGILQ